MISSEPERYKGVVTNTKTSNGNTIFDNHIM